MDPLKTHSWGVKRTLEEKQPEIQRELQEGGRYYPPRAETKLDEWGAL